MYVASAHAPPCAGEEGREWCGDVQNLHAFLSSAVLRVPPLALRPQRGPRLPVAVRRLAELRAQRAELGGHPLHLLAAQRDDEVGELRELHEPAPVAVVLGTCCHQLDCPK